MIFCFSGTGNSAWVARQLAHLTGDVACDITTLAQTPDVQKEEQVGFVFPVYAWGAPEVMTNFASKLARPQAFAFSVCTCGSEAGLTMKRFAKECPLDSSYSLVMPNNYIIGSDTDSDAVIQEKIASVRKALQQIAQEILHRQRVDRVHEGTLAGMKSRMANFGFNRFARTTIFCHGPLQRMRDVRPELPGVRHLPEGWKTPVAGAVLPAHALHQRLPHAGHPVWQIHGGTAPVYH